MNQEPEIRTENPLGYAPLPTLLRRFAVPSIIAMLVSSLYNIVDQFFIGQGVGYLGNAATNVAYPLTTICLALALLIGIGSASRFSLSLGEGNPERAAEAVGNAIGMMVLFGLAYAVVIQLFLEPLLTAFGATEDVMPYAVSYTRITGLGMPLLIITNAMSNLARADGSPKYSMACMLVGAVINTILDPICIFLLNWGVAGAAWATVAGQFVSFLMAVRYARHFHRIQLQRRHFRLRPDTCLQTVSLGLSASLNQLAITFVQIVLNNSLTYYGSMSPYGKEIPLAACGIVMKVNAIMLAVIIGINQGSQPIIGFNYGARQFRRVRDIYRLSITYNLAVSVTAFLLFQLFPAQIVGLFGDSGNALYMEFAVKFMRIFLFMACVNGVQMFSSSFFSAIGKPIRGAVLSLTRQVIFLVPLLLLLPLVFPVPIDGILFAGPIADGAAFLTSVLLVRHEMARIRQQELAQTQ